MAMFVFVVAMGSHSGDGPLPVEVFYLVIEMMVSAHSYCIIHEVHTYTWYTIPTETIIQLVHSYTCINIEGIINH